MDGAVNLLDEHYRGSKAGVSADGTVLKKRLVLALAMGFYYLAGGLAFAAFLLGMVDCVEWYKRGGVWKTAILAEITGTSSYNKAGFIAEVMTIVERTPQWAAFSLGAMLAFSVYAFLELLSEKAEGEH